MSRHAEFRDTWRGHVVHTASPNGCVLVDNVGDTTITVRIDDAWFHRASSAQVKEQLGAAFRLAFVQRTREYNRTKEAVTGVEVGPIETGRDRHVDAFVESRNSLVVEGSSPDGAVTVIAVGMQGATIQIDERYFVEHDRHGLERDLGLAATALVADQMAKMYALKQSGH